MLLTNEQYVILFQRYILIFFLDISFNKSQSALNNPYFQNFPKETGFEGFIQVLTQLATNVIDSYLTNRISNDQLGTINRKLLSCLVDFSH